MQNGTDQFWELQQYRKVENGGVAGIFYAVTPQTEGLQPGKLIFQQQFCSPFRSEEHFTVLIQQFPDQGDAPRGMSQPPVEWRHKDTGFVTGYVKVSGFHFDKAINVYENSLIC
jgi:hypothetical protein